MDGSGFGRALTALAVVACVAVTGCDRRTAVAGPGEEDAAESFVVVRGPDGGGRIIESGYDLSASGYHLADGYDCFSPLDCFKKCPEDPEEEGGSTVCDCRSNGQGGFRCIVIHYGPGETPGGGGCSGGGGGDTITAACGDLALTCPAWTERGSVATCRVTTTGAHNLDTLQYEWVAGANGHDTRTWSGTAVSTRRIAVTVRSPVDKSVLFTDSSTVHVTPRSWSFRRMTRSVPTYAVPDSASPWGWGAFATFIDWQRPSTREGSGPWEGEHYWSGPYQLRGQVYLHPDFDSTGTAYAGADSTCGGVPASANVRLVNNTCGYGGNLNLWDGMVRTHEATARERREQLSPGRNRRGDGSGGHGKGHGGCPERCGGRIQPDISGFQE